MSNRQYSQFDNCLSLDMSNKFVVHILREPQPYFQIKAYNNCKRTKLMLELTPNRAFFKKYPVFHPGASIIDLKLRIVSNIPHVWSLQSTESYWETILEYPNLKKEENLLTIVNNSDDPISKSSKMRLRIKFLKSPNVLTLNYKDYYSKSFRKQCF